jgi:hypothetical protein
MSITRGMPRGVPFLLVFVGCALLGLMIVFFMDTWATPVLLLSTGEILMFVLFFTLSLIAILFILTLIRKGAQGVKRGGHKKAK